MVRHKDPLVEALLNKQPFTITITAGGDPASMRNALKHGQILTFSPVENPEQVNVGDIVIVRWRETNYMMHLVQEIKDNQFLIVNSLGKVNGWATGVDIIGRASEIIDPPERPTVPKMLDDLLRLYTNLIQEAHLGEKDADRLESVHNDLLWYANVIGESRWDLMARQNIWSFASILWHLLREQEKDQKSGELKSVIYYVNHGKEHIGQLAFALNIWVDNSEN